MSQTATDNDVQIDNSNLQKKGEPSTTSKNDASIRNGEWEKLDQLVLEIKGPFLKDHPELVGMACKLERSSKDDTFAPMVVGWVKDEFKIPERVKEDWDTYTVNKGIALTLNLQSVFVPRISFGDSYESWNLPKKKLPCAELSRGRTYGGIVLQDNHKCALFGEKDNRKYALFRKQRNAYTFSLLRHSDGSQVLFGENQYVGINGIKEATLGMQVTICFPEKFMSGTVTCTSVPMNSESDCLFVSVHECPEFIGGAFVVEHIGDRQGVTSAKLIGVAVCRDDAAGLIACKIEYIQKELELDDHFWRWPQENSLDSIIAEIHQSVFPHMSREDIGFNLQVLKHIYNPELVFVEPQYDDAVYKKLRLAFVEGLTPTLLTVSELKCKEYRIVFLGSEPITPLESNVLRITIPQLYVPTNNGTFNGGYVVKDHKSYLLTTHPSLAHSKRICNWDTVSAGKIAMVPLATHDIAIQVHFNHKKLDIVGVQPLLNTNVVLLFDRNKPILGIAHSTIMHGVYVITLEEKSEQASGSLIFHPDIVNNQIYVVGIVESNYGTQLVVRDIVTLKQQMGFDHFQTPQDQRSLVIEQFSWKSAAQRKHDLSTDITKQPEPLLSIAFWTFGDKVLPKLKKQEEIGEWPQLLLPLLDACKMFVKKKCDLWLDITKPAQQFFGTEIALFHGDVKRLLLLEVKHEESDISETKLEDICQAFVDAVNMMTGFFSDTIITATKCGFFGVHLMLNQQLSLLPAFKNSDGVYHVIILREWGTTKLVPSSRLPLNVLQSASPHYQAAIRGYKMLFHDWNSNHPKSAVSLDLVDTVAYNCVTYKSHNLLDGCKCVIQDNCSESLLDYSNNLFGTPLQWTDKFEKWFDLVSKMAEEGGPTFRSFLDDTWNRVQAQQELSFRPDECSALSEQSVTLFTSSTIGGNAQLKVVFFRQGMAKNGVYQVIGYATVSAISPNAFGVKTISAQVQAMLELIYGTREQAWAVLFDGDNAIDHTDNFWFTKPQQPSTVTTIQQTVPVAQASLGTDKETTSTTSTSSGTNTNTSSGSSSSFSFPNFSGIQLSMLRKQQDDKDPNQPFRPKPNKTVSIVSKLSFSEACFKGNMARIIECVEMEHQDINQQDFLGNTPLHWAVRGHQSQALIYLLARRPDLSLCNSDGLTPLEMAAMNGFQDACYLIVQTPARFQPPVAISLVDQAQDKFVVSPMAISANAISVVKITWTKTFPKKLQCKAKSAETKGFQHNGKTLEIYIKEKNIGSTILELDFDGKLFEFCLKVVPDRVWFYPTTRQNLLAQSSPAIPVDFPFTIQDAGKQTKLGYFDDVLWTLANKILHNQDTITEQKGLWERIEQIILHKLFINMLRARVKNPRFQNSMFFNLQSVYSGSVEIGTSFFFSDFPLIITLLLNAKHAVQHDEQQHWVFEDKAITEPDIENMFTACIGAIDYFMAHCSEAADWGIEKVSEQYLQFHFNNSKFQYDIRPALKAWKGNLLLQKIKNAGVFVPCEEEDVCAKLKNAQNTYSGLIELVRISNALVAVICPKISLPRYTLENIVLKVADNTGLAEWNNTSFCGLFRKVWDAVRKSSVTPELQPLAMLILEKNDDSLLEYISDTLLPYVLKTGVYLRVKPDAKCKLS